MNGSNKIALWAASFFVLIGCLAQPVLACSICCSAVEDVLLPPIYLWALMASLLFLIQSMIIPHRLLPIKTVPTVPLAILVVVGLFFFGAAIAGIGMPVLLLVPVIVLAIRSWNPAWHRDWPPIFIRRERWYSVMVMVVIGAMAAQCIQIHLTRTRVDLVLKWSSAGISRGLMIKMGEQGPSGMDELREIAKRGSVYKAAEALTILADKAHSPADVPLAIATLRKAYPPVFSRPEPDQWLTQEIESALQKMSDIALPKGSSPDSWEMKWKERSGDPSGKSRN